MRPLPLLLLAVLALATSAAAQQVHDLPANTTLEFPVQVTNGQRIDVDVVANGAVDVILVRGGNASAYFAGNATLVWAQFNASEAHAGFTLHEVQDLWLLVDNSPQPANGAPGTTDLNATVDIQLTDPVLPPGDEPVPDGREPRTFWRSLMFTADYWDLNVLGLGGVAIWMLVFAAVAAWRFDSPWDHLAILAAGVAGLALLWSLLPHPGMITQVGLPLLIGAGAGYVATRSTPALSSALRLAALASILGAFVGLALGHLLHDLWSEQGLLVLGEQRFTGALFTIPVAAVAAAFLAKFVPAFVEALEDDDAKQSKTPSVPLSQTFHVDCLRCGTSITVNRSVKRYRVATDRYEFPCPNCNAWMEWSEPKPPAAA